MDISINPVSAAQLYTPPAATVTADPASTAPVSPAPQAQAAITFADTSGSSGSSGASQQDKTAARQAALSFKDTYAVSDKEFTIFKDATGKYITRYVSLRDGSVTYEPKPTFVKSLSIVA